MPNLEVRAVHLILDKELLRYLNERQEHVDVIAIVGKMTDADIRGADLRRIVPSDMAVGRITAGDRGIGLIQEQIGRRSLRTRGSSRAGCAGSSCGSRRAGWSGCRRNRASRACGAAISNAACRPCWARSARASSWPRRSGGCRLRACGPRRPRSSGR